MDIREYNREAWNKQVKKGNLWTIPAAPSEIKSAREGNWRIVLTPLKAVPHDWLPDLAGKKILCLASGGGQQGPILAAAGADVTVLDNSPAQLEQDKLVAQRENLHINIVEGDMRDLSAFVSATFHYIVHPVSNVFIPELKPMWSEAFRVLKPGGVMISGISNPVIYIFDWDQIEKYKKLEVKHKLPYSDLESLSSEQKARYIENGDPFEFSHTLEEQIGGQIEAGFVITGFYEDGTNEITFDNPLSHYMNLFIATRGLKPLR
jgi:ubiquinone/menaquinone biosynthesis C-methylase UbiE